MTNNIKHTILVLSGKGGVGKSTVTVQLANEFVNQGKKVGILDVDLCGPSIPTMLKLTEQSVHKSSTGFVPVYTNAQKQLGCISIGFLIENKDDPVIWRGPKKNAVIKQFIEDVDWGDLDILLIDTPPGTSDEHISVVQHLQSNFPDGAVIVTTPQQVSLNDVRKEISFCRKVKLPILGLVENMSGFKCPCCDEVTNIFSSEGGKLLAEQTKIPFIGTIPIDPSLGNENDVNQENTVTLSNLKKFAISFLEN